MNTVIKGTKTVQEFKEKQKKLTDLAELAYKRHKEAFEHWNEGEPVKAWFDSDNNVCVEYASGNWWHYKDLELPFPEWW